MMLVCLVSDRFGRAPWVWKASSTVATRVLMLLLSYDKSTITIIVNVLSYHSRRAARRSIDLWHITLNRLQPSLHPSRGFYMQLCRTEKRDLRDISLLHQQLNLGAA